MQQELQTLLSNDAWENYHWVKMDASMYKSVVRGL